MEKLPLNYNPVIPATNNYKLTKVGIVLKINTELKFQKKFLCVQQGETKYRNTIKVTT